jgi:hypothetical protein
MNIKEGDIFMNSSNVVDFAVLKIAKRSRKRDTVAERLRKLWIEHVVDYYTGPSECVDCHRRDCDGCGVLALSIGNRECLVSADSLLVSVSTSQTREGREEDDANQ